MQSWRLRETWSLSLKSLISLAATILASFAFAVRAEGISELSIDVTSEKLLTP